MFLGELGLEFCLLLKHSAQLEFRTLTLAMQPSPLPVAKRQRPGKGEAHLQDFNDYFFIICDVDGFKDFTVFAPAQFPD